VRSSQEQAGEEHEQRSSVDVRGLSAEHSSEALAEHPVDPGGVRGTSATASFAMKIGTPAVAAIGFDKLVDKLRCHRVDEVVRIPAHWVTGTVNGKPVRVHEKARTQRITVTRCHVRTARRRMDVWVTIRRHGKTVRVRRTRTVLVAIPPHVVSRSTRVEPQSIAVRALSTLRVDLLTVRASLTGIA
jgi:hypothetical protein